MLIYLEKIGYKPVALVNSEEQGLGFEEATDFYLLYHFYFLQWTCIYFILLNDIKLDLVRKSNKMLAASIVIMGLWGFYVDI